MPPSPTSPHASTPQEHAAVQDYRANIWNPFQNYYEDKWSQARWDAAIRDYKRRHDAGVLEALRAKKVLPPWDVLEDQLKKGPPPFLRPGWTSPLVGRPLDLRWLDQNAFVQIRGTMDDWKAFKIVLIEFWATWCRPCHNVFPHLSHLANNEPRVKVITFADEGIFNGTPTDVAALKRFVFARGDMNYPIFIDTNHVAYNALFKPGQNFSVPLVFIITTHDRKVHWVGNGEELDAPLAVALASLR
ncbi:TlpA family protein disulfide reductase [Phanerochaete sordida]|uniref:TlpA family protein disulfide reductase n=1 Tax=Phanerochaete sordida TaxID=48140 RepID=A0A9P3GJ98_9APHY|nr:TlpA family protein disulfide reductase [Phanerochaete sordida]